MKYLPLLALILVGCGTTPRTYQPPDSAKLRASTTRVYKAVEAAHISARKAQVSTGQAGGLAKKARADVEKIKNVPPIVLSGLNDLTIKLEEAESFQLELENHLKEADLAKAQVEKDKITYFNAAQKLADQATKENARAVKAEKSLSWYRWHWWGSWIVLGLGIVACVVFWIAKLAGKWTFP